MCGLGSQHANFIRNNRKTTTLFTRTSGFDSGARWAYLLLVLVGSFLGLTTELPDLFVHDMTAFLAGIILVFVISEELPLKYPGRVPWFLLGVALFVLAVWVIAQFDPRLAY